jgi:hypothetical protein
MVTPIKKDVVPMTKEQFEALKLRARELEVLMNEAEKSISEGIEGIKKTFQKELGLI